MSEVELGILPFLKFKSERVVSPSIMIPNRCYVVFFFFSDYSRPKWFKQLLAQGPDAVFALNLSSAPFFFSIISLWNILFAKNDAKKLHCPTVATDEIHALNRHSRRCRSGSIIIRNSSSSGSCGGSSTSITLLALAVMHTECRMNFTYLWSITVCLNGVRFT